MRFRTTTLATTTITIMLATTTTRTVRTVRMARTRTTTARTRTTTVRTRTTMVDGTAGSVSVVDAMAVVTGVVVAAPCASLATERPSSFLNPLSL